MSNFSRIISFGASITYGSDLPDPSNTWSSIIAKKLTASYLCLAKPAASNTSIAREILSFDSYRNDMVLVMWTSATRYEFRTVNGWESFSPWSEQKGFAKEWYRGPGAYECTEIVTTLRDILLAKQFLDSIEIPYLFMFDNNELRTSYTWERGESYVAAMANMLPWENMLWFNDTGFLEWCRDNNYPFINTHPGTEAHAAAADYILANSFL